MNRSGQRGEVWFQVLMIIVVVFVFAMLGMALISLERSDRREAATVPAVLPVLIAASHQAPAQARQTLSAVWEDLQAISPLTITPTEGGSLLRWAKVGTEGCKQMRDVLSHHPEQGERLVLIQNGATISPTSYADMTCTAGSSITSFTFAFGPRDP
jgi:hypothetical protein